MPRYLYPEQMRRLRERAQAKGAVIRVPVTRLEWSCYGRCQRPVTVEYVSRPQIKNDRVIVVNGRMPVGAHATEHVPHNAVLHVSCRRCDGCLRARSQHWRLRCMAEYAQSPRTWLGTLTFRPELQFAALNRARETCRKRGLSYEELSEEQAFSFRERELTKEVVLYLKRLRKMARFRQMFVAEAHKNGGVHYHVMLHECRDAEPLRHAALARWPCGFSNWKLVKDKNGAGYAAKYLNKSGLVRVRASIGYGSAWSRLGDSRSETDLA